MDKIHKNIKYIVGIDEVGRGPIAGPVAVCAFICRPDFFDSISIDVPLRDSKKLTRKQREKWLEFLKKEKEKENCDFAVSLVDAEWIDKVGISKCIQKALDSSLLNLIKTSGLEPRNYKLMLDGGLKAREEYIYQETIIKGDELHPVISCASIIAKVTRDNLMFKYAEKFPDHGFENHVGYGTKAHYNAIKKHGQTSIHRKTFIH
jgi:ribonuclease HII